MPLALGSFCFFKGSRLLIGPLLHAQAARFNKAGFRWSVLCEETIRSDLTLAVLMTRGPRWNPHALIASSGPFPVADSLSISAPPTTQSCASWSIVIYHYPGLQTISSFNSSQTPVDGWLSQKLPPGKYSLGLRHYDPSPETLLPAVRADGKEVLAARPAPSNTNNFYSKLHHRAKWFHGAMHYYVFPMLRWRQRLSENFVRANYLPVGDPDTHFYFGRLRRGECLKCESPGNLFDNFRLFYTQYNRASFPVSWREITEQIYATAPASHDGYYLFRLRPRQPGAKSAVPHLGITIIDDLVLGFQRP